MMNRKRRAKYAAKKSIESSLMIMESINNALGLEVTPIPTVSEIVFQDLPDSLMMNYKQKLSVSDFKEKVKILTLVPLSWTVPKVESYFNISKHLIRKARSTLSSNGILSDGETESGSNTLSENTIINVRS